MSEFFHPKLQSVEALENGVLRTGWSTGEVLNVDVRPKLKKLKSLTHLLEPKLFATVHVAEWGNGIEWQDSELGADNVYAWAKEQAGAVSHEMFDGWMRRNGLSLSAVAEALGISRRMASYYRTAHKVIPRSIWLACLGWEATKPNPQTLPRALPTVRQYALAHA